jgi:hypothetical protein
MNLEKTQGDSMRPWVKKLKRSAMKLTGDEPCEPAIIWLVENDFINPQVAWEVCHRVDWMFWFLHYFIKWTPSLNKLIVTAVRQMVKRKLYVLETELRYLKTIEAAKDWADNSVNSVEEARKASREVIWAADTVAWEVAKNVAWEAANTTGEEAVAAAWATEQQVQADILRQYISFPALVLDGDLG